MSELNPTFTEQYRIVRVAPPDATGVGTVTLDNVDTRGFLQGVFLLDIGVIGATTTIDCTIKQSATSGGTYATIFTATQIVQAGDETTRYLNLNFRNPNFATKPWIQINVVVGTAAGDLGALLILGNPMNSATLTQPAATSALDGTWATDFLAAS